MKTKNLLCVAALLTMATLLGAFPGRGHAEVASASSIGPLESDNPEVSAPNVTLSPSHLFFECRNLINGGCGCITSRTTTLTNVGNAPLDIKGFSVTGAFVEGNNCGSVLGAGKSCSIHVGWSAKNSGGGSVSVRDNAPGSPQQIGLYGLKACLL